MFTIQTAKRKKIITIDDDFATLIEIKDNVLEFEFEYTISKKDIIDTVSSKLKVSAFTRIISLRSDMNELNQIITDSESSIEDYMSLNSKLKDKTKSKEQYIVSRRNIDPKIAVSNEFVQDEKIGAKTYTSKLMMKKSKSLKSENVNVLIPGGKAGDYETDEKRSDKLLLMQLATQNKKDLSSIVENVRSSHCARSSFDRFSQKKGKYNPPNFSISRYAQSSFVKSNEPARFSSEADDNTIAYVVETIEENNAFSRIKLFIDQEKLYVDKAWRGSLIIIFELFDSSGNVIEVIRKNLDVSSHIRRFNMPTCPPYVMSSSTGATRERTNLRIRQVDKKATKVRVYKRNITRTPGEYGSYAFTGEYELLTGNQKIVNVPRPRTGFALYRVIPISEDNVISHEYTNVVVHAIKQESNLFHPVVTTTQNDLGVNVEILNIPDSVASLRINRRDATLHDRNYRIVSPTLFLLSSNTISWIDTVIAEDHIYEYNVTLVYRTGDHVDVGHSIIEVLDRKKAGFIDISINNFKINDPLALSLLSDNQRKDQDKDGEMNVTFNISSHITNNSSDNLKLLLEKQGISDLFGDEIKEERDLLKDVMAFNVKRIDLLTGQINDFGVITEQTFNERAISKNLQIEPVRQGGLYRYIVTPLVMPPENLFSKFEKTEKDPYTKREFKFKPSKFRHPLALKRGIISSKLTQKKYHAKESIMFGKLGSSTQKDVSFSKKSQTIEQLTVQKFDRATVLVKWNSPVGDDIIDSFFVLSEINGEREIIGKVHGEVSQTHKFYHRYNEDDFGSIKYVIIPILNNFSRGQEAVTNQIVLG